MFAFHIPRHMTKWRGTGLLACHTQGQFRPDLPRHLIRQFHRGGSRLGWPSRGLPRPAATQQPRPHQLLTVRRACTAQSVRDLATNNPIILRDACPCPRCVDPSTRQRDFNYADIPVDISPASIEEGAEGDWTVTWANDVPGYDNHASRYPRSTLERLLQGPLPGLSGERMLSLWDKDTFPVETVEIDYDALLADQHILATALERIQRHGLLFIVNVPEDESAVMKMVTRLTGLYRNTFYGQSWNVRSVPQAKNVAYTSKYLGFHMDLLYMKEPPGLQLLHCLQNSCRGGESQFVDTFKAVDLLRRESTRFFDVLSNRRIRYGYSNDGHSYADAKPVIQMGDTRNFSRPLPRVLGASVKNKDVVARLESVFWSPPFIDTIDTGSSRSDTEEFVVASKAFADILHRPELIFEAKLPAGMCAIFDNLRVVHARRAFDINSGSRWLKGIYGDRQDLRSETLKHTWNKEAGVQG